METVIQKWGNSSAVRLPKPLLKMANISDSDTLQISATEGEIIIRKKEKAHILLKERLREFEGSYESEDTGLVPAGKEIFW